MNTTAFILLFGFAYALFASYLAYRETGDKWMLIFPAWIDAKCGVSSRVRWHGKISFGLLLAGILLLRL